MNSLYDFTLHKTVTTEETVDTPEGKLTRKVDSEVPVRVRLKKPSRQENEAAEELYATELHRCIKAGMLTEPLLVKYYADQGGIFSEEEQKEYSSLLIQFVEKQNDYQRASLLEESPEKQEKLKAATSALVTVQTRLQDFKRAQQSLFNQTAEKRASDKTIMCYVTKLTYLAEGEGEPVPMFKGKTLEDRLNELDSFEEKGDTFMLKVFQKALLFITFWYMGNAEQPEDFKYLEDAIAPDEELSDQVPAPEAESAPTPEPVPETA